MQNLFRKQQQNLFKFHRNFIKKSIQLVYTKSVQSVHKTATKFVQSVQKTATKSVQISQKLYKKICSTCSHIKSIQKPVQSIQKSVQSV